MDIPAYGPDRSGVQDVSDRYLLETSWTAAASSSYVAVGLLSSVAFFLVAVFAGAPAVALAGAFAGRVTVHRPQPARASAMMTPMAARILPSLDLSMLSTPWCAPAACGTGGPRP